MPTRTLLTENKGKTAGGFAIELANDAGRIIRERFEHGLRAGMHVSFKPDKTIVTETDMEINRLVIKSVRSNFPTHNVLGEEESSIINKSEFTWVCDPVDGTWCFSRGIPTCVFSLALLENGRPILGVVYHPLTENMFHAEEGKGARVNGRQISVSMEGLYRSEVGLCTWPGSLSEQADLSSLHYELNQSRACVLNLGSLAYMNTLVANGTLIASIHPAKSPVDSAAAVIIVKEAGGRVTDLLGNDQRYDGDINGCIFSNGKIHEELVDMVRKVKGG